MLGHAGQQTGVLPPHQLAEISRLLSQYHEGVEMQSAHVNSASSASQILSFLASLPQQLSFLECVCLVYVSVHAPMHT